MDTLNDRIERHIASLTDSLQALRDTLDSITHPVITPIITFHEDLIDGIVTIASAEHADTIKIYDGSNNLVATIEPVTVGDVISTGLTEGDYTVITTNTTGGSTTTTITVHITTYTLTLSPASSTQNICAGGSTNITYTVSGGSEPYKWFVNGVEKTGETASTLVLTFNSVGSTEIKVTGHNCDTPKVTQTIAIAPDPIIGICEEEHNATVTLKSMDNTTKIEIYDLSDVLQKTITSPAVGDLLVSSGALSNGTYKLVAKSEHNCTVTRNAIVGRPETYCNVTALNANELGATATRVDSVRDHEGNWYDVVQIGFQCWLRENLRTETSPRNPSVSYVYYPSTTITMSHYQAQSFYLNNEETTKNRYGLLYNWSAAMDSNRTTDWTGSETFPANYRGICPEGCHLPTDADWKILETQLGVDSEDLDKVNSYRGSIAGKLSGGCEWSNLDNVRAPGSYLDSERNATQFTALPVGDFRGFFDYFGNVAFFWTATQHNSIFSWYRMFYFSTEGVYRSRDYGKYNGYSVRCVRN